MLRDDASIHRGPAAGMPNGLASVIDLIALQASAPFVIILGKHIASAAIDPADLAQDGPGFGAHRTEQLIFASLYKLGEARA